MIKLAYCDVENLDLKKAYPLVPRERRDAERKSISTDLKRIKS